MGDPPIQFPTPQAPAIDPESQTSDAFEALLSQHSSAVKLYVRSLLPGHISAEDVAQETMILLWEKRDQFTPGTHFKAWAFQIAKFLVMNQRRKLARSREVVLDDELLNRIDEHWQQPEAAMITDSHHEALTQCLEILKPEDRQLLHARYATKVSLETYAIRTGARPGTLKARLFRLRDALRDCIERRLMTP